MYMVAFFIAHKKFVSFYFWHPFGLSLIKKIRSDFCLAALYPRPLEGEGLGGSRHLGLLC